jgi:hypothetical protein
LSLALGVDFISLYTHKMLLWWSLFAPSGFWMFDVCDHTYDIDISRACRVVEKEALVVRLWDGTLYKCGIVMGYQISAK